MEVVKMVIKKNANDIQDEKETPPATYTAAEIFTKIEAWFQDRFRNKSGISDTDHYGYVYESKEELKKLF
jgi:hypothetical protein